MSQLKKFYFAYLLPAMKDCLKNNKPSFIIPEDDYLKHMGRNTCEKDFRDLKELLKVTDSKVVWRGDAGIEIIW